MGFICLEPTKWYLPCAPPPPRSIMAMWLKLRHWTLVVSMSTEARMNLQHQWSIIPHQCIFVIAKCRLEKSLASCAVPCGVVRLTMVMCGTNDHVMMLWQDVQLSAQEHLIVLLQCQFCLCCQPHKTGPQL